MIRLGTEQDLKAIKRIANQNREFIGFVMNVALKEAIKHDTLHVYEHEGQIIGFMHCHKRKDGWTTLHEIGIDKAFQKQGIGQQLLKQLDGSIRLKTTIDNIQAIRFYLNNGYDLVRTEQGKKRELLVFERQSQAVLSPRHRVSKQNP